jgi:hypothetical protein
MGRRAILGLLLSSPLFCCAQEFDPHDPAIIADGLSRSSAVVIGKFAVDWCWPWLDGWHCSGAIHVEESLYGDRKVKEALVFYWKEPYGSTWCFACAKLCRLDGDRAIWFLERQNGAWRFSGPHAFWCDESVPLDCRDAAVQCVRQRGMH